MIQKHLVHWFFFFFLLFCSHLGTWLKQKQLEKKTDEQIKDENIFLEKSPQNLSTKSSDSSSITTENTMDLLTTNILPNYRTHSNRYRPYSATLRSQTILPDRSSLIKEIFHRRHPWESDDYLYQHDSNEPLTKSALIYRLMRSRLEANLAKSISASRDRTDQKKKFSSSTHSS